MDPNTDPIRKNCFLLFELSLKTPEDGGGPVPLELSCDRITAHRTADDAAEVAGQEAVLNSDQHLYSYVIVPASELSITVRARPPRQSDEQSTCKCDEPMTFGMSQTCLRCGGRVTEDPHDHEDIEEEEDD